MSVRRRCAEQKLSSSVLAYGAKLWTACSLLPLLPDAAPACRPLVHSTRVPREGGLAGTAKAPGSYASCRHRNRQQAARTPKLRDAHFADRPPAWASSWTCASYLSRIAATSY